MIEDFGVSARAELYICTAEVFMTSKNSVTKWKQSLATSESGFR